MGSSYSDLYFYFKLKTGNYGIPNNGQPNNGDQQKKENQIFSVEVKKSNYQGCVNFEKVIHDITFKPPDKGLNYNIILNDSCDKDKSKGKNIFGYYYPSDDKVVLKELHVYYSVLAPNDPLVVSFVTRGNQTHNFLYSGLLSTRWVRAYSISYYSLGQDVSSELLTNEFRKSHKNRKIKFVTGQQVEEVSGFKQDLEKNNVYRYIYYPNGDKAVLGSECLCKFVSDTPVSLVCPKPSETANNKPAETPKADAQTKSPNYDNKIDPYFLDLVNGHHYDGVILYFVKNGTNSGGSVASGNHNNRQTAGNGNHNSVGRGGSNGQGKAQNDNYDHNMAVLLELIDNCKPKTHIKRKDKLGNYWSQEKVKYDDDTKLIAELKSIQSSAEKNESTTFILEITSSYKGVSNVNPEKDKNTYSKYTHNAVASIKPNFLFRKKDISIGNYTPNNDKTKSLDVYFLKTEGTEQDWPFIIMITNLDEKPAEPKPAAPAGSAGTNGASSQQQQPPQQQQSGAAGSSSTEPKTCKKCYFSSENYEFKDWKELTVDKKEATKPEAEENKAKNGKQTSDPDKELEEKLKERLAKIEEYGKCTKDINILRSIAYQVLTGVDKPDPTKSAPSEPEKRPKVTVFKEKGTGTSLPVVLGSVAGGLVVLGIISAIIYGIYWYNTTIKLLT